jgi:hypothetical protein
MPWPMFSDGRRSCGGRGGTRINARGHDIVQGMGLASEQGRDILPRRELLNVELLIAQQDALLLRRQLLHAAVA